MKKTPLVFFILTPMLLVGCNKNSTLSFNNPFPEDTYNKTGFNFRNEEIAKNPLTSDQKNLVDTTAGDTSFNKYIYQCKSEIHVRDYMRAFAGIFKQGYSSSNLLYDDTAITYRQDEDDTYKERRWTKHDSKIISDYSYGKMTNTIKSNEYNYYGIKDPDGIVKDSDITNADRICNQSFSRDDTTLISSDILAWKVDEDWKKSQQAKYDVSNAFSIKQSDFIFKIDECTVPAGSNGEEVILVKETKEQHQGSKVGRVVLGDKKEFLAMDNSLIVTRLKKKTVDSVSFYCATNVRKYEETVITSEEIQPNIQITMLSNPLVIRYSECKYEFSIDDSVKTTKSFNAIADKEMPQ